MDSGTFDMVSSTNNVSARVSLSLLGKLIAAAELVVLGRLHFHPLQMALQTSHASSVPHKFDYGLNQTSSSMVVQQGAVCTGSFSQISPCISHSVYGLQHSQLGCSSGARGTSFHGVWSTDQSLLHINLLEMMAISCALKEAQHVVADPTILIATDSTSVVACIRKQGETHSPSLCLEGWNLLLWCQERGITLSARHIPGKFNILGDCLSRLSKPVQIEWSLSRRIANAFWAMKWHVRPAKTQISLGIRPVWSESSLSAWRKLGSLATHWAQAKTLIRLGRCPGWSESLLGTHAILLVLSWGGSFFFFRWQAFPT